ncbi:MAG: phospho-N-acetylmuramoyl-pentapeptide-transferase [Mycobacterium sp.]|jgi:UDP-N-acetylmuramyl pentapeptide phosphotransferase/UDP-N-acetylglucosamine-1-phosphate transferase|nr:phospho-N-acetylmuramoyl-pentapeptide-transferase [Mycobacterium sp.]
MSHQRKRGTPTMGGLAIVTAIWASYLGTNLLGLALGGEGPSASGLLVLGLATALGAVGFTDDYVKLRRSRNRGLNKRAKSAGQLVSAQPRLTMHKNWTAPCITEKDAAMMATSPTSSAVSAAADVWISRSGEPSNSRRLPTSEIRGSRSAASPKTEIPRLVEYLGLRSQ